VVDEWVGGGHAGRQVAVQVGARLCFERRKVVFARISSDHTYTLLLRAALS
jgi:hypothetical protein